MSEKPDSRPGGVEPLSKLSRGNMLSILSLPELTKDMSESVEQNSYGFPFGARLCENGDLFEVY